jgi:hypothetical protein
MIYTLNFSLRLLHLKHGDYIQLPRTEIFHLMTRVHGSVLLKMYLRPQVGTEVMYGFHCNDFRETYNYSIIFFMSDDTLFYHSRDQPRGLVVRASGY